ncbi:hypothetical protein D9757_007160 [Collybiopsis confluens]|uniref:Ribosomal L1 domain-containing protein 1 n=1 Tax=Collybiopsis confluens TaxID=2823264 RepID=A0A8H5HCQ1_9AGAR|nr:hypothetical protein D9757_007160 [Collybiopsis confluens]
MTDSKISERVLISQCEAAIDALVSHVTKFTEKKAESQLLPDAEPIFWLTIALKKQPEGNALKVFKIPVAHPIIDPRKESVCLLTKEPQRTYKDLIADNDIKFIHRVIDISKLKGKFKAYDARRALLKQHGLFLADDRILPLLPKLLGSKFFEAKKQPLPVTVTRKDLKAELERAISSTYMPNIRGTSISIKIGRLSQKPSHILDNLKTALPVIAEKINGGWDNIQSLGLKTSNSINLPLWTCQLTDEDGGRWTGLTAAEDEDEDEDVEMDGDDSSGDAPVAEVPVKGRKRAAAADEDEGEKPNKKSKNSTTTSIDETPSVPNSKKKKESGFAPTPVNTPATANKAAPAATVPTPDTPATKKKGKKKSVAVESTSTPAPVVATADVSTTKKSKKARASEGAVANVPKEETSTSISGAPKQKKKKGENDFPSPATIKGVRENFPTAVAQTAPAKEQSKTASKKMSSEEAVPTQEVGQEKEEEVVIVKKIGGGNGGDASQKKTKKAKKTKGDDGAALPLPSSVEAKDDGDDSLPPAKENKKEKKDKKGKNSTDAPVVPMVVAPAPLSSDASKVEKKKERRGKKLTEVPAAPMDVDPIPDLPEVETEKKEKKTKKVKPAEEIPVAATSLSKDELKQKKIDTPGEKKKGKVVKTKTGKSAKDLLLGKKVL